MSIKIAGAQKMVRQTTAPFEYEKDGEICTDQIVVRYYDQTAKDAKDRHEASRLAYNAAKEKGELEPFEYFVDTLSVRLESLPDLAGADNKAFPITPESLGLLSTKNINAIHQAIQGDAVPNEPPTK
jgi:hypothetical protein